MSAGFLATSGSGFIFNDPNSRSSESYYAAFGKLGKTKNSFFQLGLGVSVNNIHYYGQGISGFLSFGAPLKETKSNVFGMVGEFKVGVAGSLAGLCLSSFINVNKEFTHGGIMIGVLLGQVKRRR